MTESYKELLEQRELLEQKIKEARQVELASAVAMVREIVAEYSLTQDDVFPKGRGSRSSSAAVSSVALMETNLLFRPIV